MITKNFRYSCAFVLLLTACAANKPPVATMNPTYVSETEITSSLAVLPVMSGEGVEGFRRSAAESFSDAIAGLHGSRINVVTETEVRDRLNSAGLTDEYSDLINDYRNTGIISREALSEMGDAIGVEYFLSTTVGYTQYELQSQLSQELEVTARVWGVERADVVWEAFGGVRNEVSTAYGGGGRVSVPVMLQMTASALARKLPVAGWDWRSYAGNANRVLYPTSREEANQLAQDLRRQGYRVTVIEVQDRVEIRIYDE